MVRDFVRGNSAPKPDFDALAAGFTAVLSCAQNVRPDSLPPAGIRNANYSRRGYVWVLFERPFNICRRDVLSA